MHILRFQKSKEKKSDNNLADALSSAAARKGKQTTRNSICTSTSSVHVLAHGDARVHAAPYRAVGLMCPTTCARIVQEYALPRPFSSPHFPALLLPIWRKKSMTFLLLPELPLLAPESSYASANFLLFCSLPPLCPSSPPIPCGYCARCG
jgi:hypothetical protein